jgi:hypothetical protein
MCVSINVGEAVFLLNPFRASDNVLLKAEYHQHAVLSIHVNEFSK